MTLRETFALPLTLAIVLLCAPHLALGQELSVPGLGLPPLNITMSPAHPRAGDSVLLSLSGTDLNRSDIQWFRDGSPIDGSDGKKSIAVQAGALGSSISISAAVDSPEDVHTEASATIRPAEIDILWSANSYTPPFFRGRALPSPGSSLILETVSRLRTSSGFISPQNLIYTWRRNGALLESASGRGRSSAILPAPQLYGTDTVSVEAASLDGSIVASSRVQVSAVEPTLELYEDHPLFGPLYHQALGASSLFSTLETTLRAVPLFLYPPSPKDGGLVWEWSVNAYKIETDPAEPDILTIDAANSSGVADIGLELTHESNWFLDSKGAWHLQFGTSRSSVDSGFPFGQ